MGAATARDGSGWLAMVSSVSAEASIKQAEASMRAIVMPPQKLPHDETDEQTWTWPPRREASGAQVAPTDASSRGPD